MTTQVVVIALTVYWADETWGPRYLVPVAAFLLVPIGWWATSPARRRVVAVLAGLGLVVSSSPSPSPTPPPGPCSES